MFDPEIKRNLPTRNNFAPVVVAFSSFPGRTSTSTSTGVFYSAFLHLTKITCAEYNEAPSKKLDASQKESKAGRLRRINEKTLLTWMGIITHGCSLTSEIVLDNYLAFRQLQNILAGFFNDTDVPLLTKVTE